MSNSERQRSIYSSDPERYDALIRAEDCDSNILPAIERVTTVPGSNVVDVGAGTGRLARMLHAYGANVIALDRELGMLELAARRLAFQANRHGGSAAYGTHPNSWHVAAADACALPLPDATVDVACAGWVFGHFPYWSPDDWRPRVERALGEMRRVVRPGGVLILFETLGTATEEPAPPSELLAAYHEYLESSHGFAREVLQTDYKFWDVGEAERLCRFFFGPECAEKVVANQWSRVPEFTGMWWVRL